MSLNVTVKDSLDWTVSFRMEDAICAIFRAAAICAIFYFLFLVI